MQITYGDIVDETELPERFLAVVSRGPGKLYIQEYVRNGEMSVNCYRAEDPVACKSGKPDSRLVC